MPSSPYQERELEYDPFNVKETQRTSSAELAITPDEFDALLEGARNIEYPITIESEFLVICAGRLGLRTGEIIHMKRDWVDLDEQWIQIPMHEPCDKGRKREICGYCRRLADQMAEVNDAPKEQTRDLYWKAKTVRAARTVPYSFSDRCVDIIERYFERFDETMVSSTALKRRFKRAAEEAPQEMPKITAHGLRATAAMHHVDTGIDMWALQSLMGWAYPNTARRYILNNSKRTRKLLEERHETTNR
jgi:integrase